MTLVHVVRHAFAGHRDDWRADDNERPLTQTGVAQAMALNDHLAGGPVARVVSSPAVRCVQTVEPVAATHGLDVERSDDLAEGADIERTLTLVRELGGTAGAVACSHGDMIPALLVALARQGVPLFDGGPLSDGSTLRCAKGSIWDLLVEGGSVVRGTYLAPSALR